MPQETAQQEATEQESAPEEKGAEEDEGEKEDGGVSSSSGVNSLVSPEAVMMLMIFGIIDIIDFFVASLWIVDIPAILIFFAWTITRSSAKDQNQGVVVKEKAAKTVKKVSTQAKKAKWLKPLAIVLEFIPIVGMVPLWVLAVYLELKE